MAGRAARAAVIQAALGAVLLLLSGCQYLSGRSETVGSAMYAGEPDIRVRVKKAAESVTLEGPARVTVRSVTGSAAPATLTTPVRVEVGPGGITLSDADGAEHAGGLATSLEVLALGEGAAPARGLGSGAGAGVSAAIAVDGSPLPGVLTLRPRSDAGGAFDVIATMPMETYLPGVLDGEMWASWPLGAFEIQAVAARSYALFEREEARRDRQPFDVENTTVDQVFKGLTKNPVALDAARRTRGQVVTYRGKIIKAYYSSTCGGRAASAGDVWPIGEGFEENTIAPLKAAERTAYCQSSPFWRWDVTRGDDDVSRRIRAWGAENGHEVRRFGRIMSATPSRANALGRPTEFRLTDDKGQTYRMGAEQLRSASNFAAPGLPGVTRETRVPSGDLELVVWADQVKYTGRGFGHGVGMCQWCAKGMGDRGIPFAKAIESFYPGAKVGKAY